MNVAVNLQVGMHGGGLSLTPMNLDVPTVGATSSWAGSYHVLSMGRHYDDYVITGRMLSFPPITGMPTAHPYRRLAGKIRSAGVTGNIGEAIAAIFARRCLGAGIGDIAHIRPRRPFQSRKAPDYLMRLGSYLPGPFNALVGSLSSITWPTWIPVESKARSTGSGARSARQEALMQLATYWSLIASTCPAEVGYGIVVTLVYQPPREVRANIIVPSNQAALIAEVSKGVAMNESVVKGSLHAC